VRMANARDLTWDRVDLERGHAWVPSSHYKTKRAFGFPLSAQVIALLRSLTREHERVFLRDGKPITGTFNAKAFRKARERAGLPGLRWHDLRHSFASSLARAGASTTVLMAMGGWTSPKMPGRYAHLSSDDTRKWANAVGTNAGSWTDEQGSAVAADPLENMVPEKRIELPTRALRMRSLTKKG
jgi:integrase